MPIHVLYIFRHFPPANHSAYSQSSPPHARHCCVILINQKNPHSISDSPGRADKFRLQEVDQIRKKRRNILSKRELSEEVRERHLKALLDLPLKLHHTCRSCIYFFIYTTFFYLKIYSQVDFWGKPREKSRSFSWVNVRRNIIEHLTRRDGGRKGN